MITHTVFFRLKHAEGSAEERKFLTDSLALAKLPTVKNFRQLRQTSIKNNFRFGFAMEFDDEIAYNQYNLHPAHVAYVRDTWIPQVSEFMEIDYVNL